MKSKQGVADNPRMSYTAHKEEIMSPKYLQEADTFIDWFKSAWQAKEDIGLFDKYKLTEKYWEGTVNEAYFETDPASNTNIVHPNTETLTGMITSAKLEALIEGSKPDDKNYEKPLQYMANFILKSQNDLGAKARKAARRLVKYGNAVLRTLYNADMLNGIGCAEIKTVNSAYLFVDSNVVDLEDKDDAQYMIETRFRSIHSARTLFGDELADAIFPNYDPVEDVQIYGESNQGGDESQLQNYIHMYIFFKELEKNEDENGFSYYAPKMRMVEMSACGVVLSDSRDEKSYSYGMYFPNEDFPYDIVSNYEREGTIWAKSDAELMFDLQDQLNDFDDQMRTNARLMGNPQKVLDPISGIDPNSWTGETALVLTASGGLNSVGYLQPKPLAQEISMQRNRIMDRDSQIVTRVNSQMSGQRQSGVDTATEALALRESGATVTDAKEEVVSILFGNALRKAIMLSIHYWDEEMFFSVTGSKDFISFNPSKLASVPVLKPASPEYMDSFKEKHADDIASGKKSVPKYETARDTDGNEITKMVEFGINVVMGAAVQREKTFNYSVMKQSWGDKSIKKSTYLKFLKDVMNVMIPQEEIEEAVQIEQIQFQQLMQAISNPGGPTQNNPGPMSAPSSGGSQRPQSPIKGEVDSIAKTV